MKRTVPVIALLSALLTANAQEKVKEVVSDDYDRSGLTVIVVSRGDMYDENSLDFVNTLVIDNKFDANPIGTRSLFLKKDRTQPLTAAEADSLIRNSGVSKEILGYIYNRKEDGSMDDGLIRYRGHYNADDQDVINAAAAKVGEQHLAWGEGLVNSSYILLLDFFNIRRPVDEKIGEVSGSYVLDANAFVYKIDCGSDKLNEFYVTSWASATDSPERKAAAREAFDSLRLDVVPVASARASSTSTSGLAGGSDAYVDVLAGLLSKSLGQEEDKEGQVKEKTSAPVPEENTVVKAQKNAFADAMFKLEKLIPGWQVGVAVISVKPIKAKVGRKEGLSNGSRFRAYSYEEDRDGNLLSRKRGYIRAAEVSDNRQFATGRTEPSTFYQISGVRNIEEGWILKEKKDIKLGVSANMRIGGLSALSVNATLDYLIHFSKLGSAYAIVSAGLDPLVYTQNQVFKDKEDNPVAISNFNLAVGAGYGFRAGRFVELMPYVVVGTDYLKLDGDMVFEDFTDEENNKNAAFFLEPGLRASFQVAYPFSICLKGGYDLLLNDIDARTHYDYINRNLDPRLRHRSGVFIEVGFRYAF